MAFAKFSFKNQNAKVESHRVLFFVWGNHKKTLYLKLMQI